MAGVNIPTPMYYRRRRSGASGTHAPIDKTRWWYQYLSMDPGLLYNKGHFEIAIEQWYNPNYGYGQFPAGGKISVFAQEEIDSNLAPFAEMGFPEQSGTTYKIYANVPSLQSSNNDFFQLMDPARFHIEGHLANFLALGTLPINAYASLGKYLLAWTEKSVHKVTQYRANADFQLGVALTPVVFSNYSEEVEYFD